MSCIDAKEIKERNTIPPAQEEKSACQYRHHRQNIQHKVNKEIAGKILIVCYEHFPWML
jgi:hypothetical protein